MRTNKVVATLVAILFLVVMVGAVNVVNAKTEFEGSGYAVSFPGSPEIIPGGKTLARVWSDSQFGYEDGALITIWINKSYFVTSPPDKHSLSSLQDVIVFDNYHDSTDKPLKESYQTTTNNGYTVFVIERETYPTTKCRQRRYYIPRGDGTTCVIECRAWKEDYDIAIKQCEPVVQSFKFKGGPMPTPEEGVPGFGAVFAIAGLSAVAYLLRRRGSKKFRSTRRIQK